MRNVLKIGGVIFGAVVITALGIDAADTFSGSRSTLLGQLIATEENVCPEGMQEVQTATTFSCVDMYEAAPGPLCSNSETISILESGENIADADCAPVSEKDRRPWSDVNREDAQLLCVRAGKRLPTNEEWQFFAQGTPDTVADCNVAGNSLWRTGRKEGCVSAIGVFDAVGNIWEWTHDDVIDRVYNGRTLPEEGYVHQVDVGGVATVATSTPHEAYGEDYFWTKEKGAFAMMRGGYYGSQEDAGVYAVHAATPPSTTGGAIGFRCVK